MEISSVAALCKSPHNFACLLLHPATIKFSKTPSPFRLSHLYKNYILQCENFQNIFTFFSKKYLFLHFLLSISSFSSCKRSLPVSAILPTPKSGGFFSAAQLILSCYFSCCRAGSGTPLSSKALARSIQVAHVPQGTLAPLVTAPCILIRYS